MALKVFRFAYDSKKLNELLIFALTGMVRDELDRFEMPEIKSGLDLLYTYRGLRYEDEVEFNFLPPGNSVKNFPIDFVVVCDVGFNPGEEEAGLYAYSEFARELYAELLRQSNDSNVPKERALKIIEKFDLEKYADA
jgi:hypothetical protein